MPVVSLHGMYPSFRCLSWALGGCRWTDEELWGKKVGMKELFCDPEAKVKKLPPIRDLQVREALQGPADTVPQRPSRR